METMRFKAVEEQFRRTSVPVEGATVKISEYYGINVFDLERMQRYLSKEAYKSVLFAVETGNRIDRKVADQVASGMKDWAVGRGATHYTHWFHPLTGGTAEKHDAFIDLDKNGKAFESFSGNLLSQQEPDASSFPHGGLRNTFEARGYTAWDPSSPAFILDKTLCIPTIFISYTGEALDFKTPLLKSVQALDKAAVDVCHYFDKDVKKVVANLGWEQEYFLVDDALYQARPDLVLTNRTLMGHSSAKDQQLEDHYFGAIPERVSAFMRDFEIESYKLGIPIKTRHNEVAPNQFECAPIFEEVNLANDHNQLVMEVMRRTARRHHFRVLFHEKPFAGVNGSGKHNNWSMGTDTGVNLLQPGKTSKKNLQFLTFLVNTIKAVHVHGDLLRAGIVSAGNAHRLGANEAPPSIMSVFLGTQLSKTLDDLEIRVTEQKMTPDEKTALKLDIGKIPEILLDNTDRNRTSPFAFTGNRFEFRAVGSSQNCASPMLVLNTAVANQLRLFKTETDALIEKGVKKDEAILQILRKYIIESRNVRFEGNGYGESWPAEAAKRGLSNINCVPEALSILTTDATVDFFERNKVLNRKELESRYEVGIEEFTKKIQIESRVLGDLAVNHIIPTVIKYQNTLIESAKGLKEIYGEKDFKAVAGRQLETIKKISEHISEIMDKVDAMIAVRRKANRLDEHKKVYEYDRSVRPFLEQIREHIDDLELIVDDEMWPLPKYRELLFSR
jgi:glutamine synthetase